MYEFLKFVEKLVETFPVHVEITYSKTTDWSILIYKKGAAKQYPNCEHCDDDAVLVCSSEVDMELCFASAYVMLKEWLMKYRGGY